MKKPPTAIKRSKSPYYFIGIGFIGIVLSYISYTYYIAYISLHHKTLDIESILPPSGAILKSIAIPRVSGTRSNARVREFIKSHFKPSIWEVEEDYHVIDSPHAPTPFTNLIINHKKSWNPDASRIILAAHYDSKLLEAESLSVIPESLESQFIGATDSAWACSLIIYIAKSLEHLDISPKKNFQIIFFDGEEAVKHWSPSDSLYGSRALASKWSKLPSSHPNSLSKIDLMVLLDLLGCKDGTNFYSFHPSGSKIDLEFKRLIAMEEKLYPRSYLKRFFIESAQFKSFKGQAVEDDHTPFLPFGVPILHLIPLPFPSVWHTQKDTLEALDRETCRKLTFIIQEYIFEILRNK